MGFGSPRARLSLFQETTFQEMSWFVFTKICGGHTNHSSMWGFTAEGIRNEGEQRHVRRKVQLLAHRQLVHSSRPHTRHPSPMGMAHERSQHKGLNYVHSTRPHTTPNPQAAFARAPAGRVAIAGAVGCPKGTTTAPKRRRPALATTAAPCPGHGR